MPELRRSPRLRAVGAASVAIGCVLIATWSGISPQSSTTALGPPATVDPATSCGPVSLGLVGRWLGKPVALGDLNVWTHAGDTGSATLGELKRAAESMGLAAEGVRLDPSRPIDWKLPMILHLPNHFVAVLPVDGESLVVADPPGEPVVIARSDLNGRWAGGALVLARSRDQLDSALAKAGLRPPP
jgi:ABC-type bacteriocin/lantibiotic exporter with double-glycine peptidase domain